MAKSEFTEAEGCIALLIIWSVQITSFIAIVWLAAQVVKHVFLG